MAKHKVSELTGPLLDYWVAKAQGLACALEVYPMTVPKPTACWLLPEGARLPNFSAGPYAPSTDWAQAGPLIERERIAIWHCDEGWAANMPGTGGYPGDMHYIDACILYEGPGAGSPLVAAMRAFVVEKVGDEVDD